MALLKPLPRSSYARDTHAVAQELLGKVLVHTLHTQKLAGRIVEVEAYVGEDDLACHASRGRTPRTDIMYGEVGHAYIYLIYGMYHCLNVVTEKKDFPAAVLIRAIEPLSGIEAMQHNRKQIDRTKLASGPGKLTQALAINRTLNGVDMTKDQRLYIADDGFQVSKKDIATSTRIGVAYAGACALYPWRYYIASSGYVSKTSLKVGH